MWKKWALPVLIIFNLIFLQGTFLFGKEGDAPKQKIVIFWGSIGFGHLSAARAIAAELKASNPNAEVVLKDSLEFMPGVITYSVKGGYDVLTQKIPTTYDFLFNTYMYFGARAKSMGNMWIGLRIGPSRVLDYLNEEKPTLIISTFNHATEALIYLKERGALGSTPVGQVETDYVDAKYFERLGEGLEMSFVPHEDIRQSWISQGIPENRVATSGIPVATEAFLPLPAAARIQFLTERGLNPEVQTVTLVSGSAGVGNFPVIIKSIAANVKGDLQIVAVCAKNTKHFEKLTAMRPSLPSNIKLKVLGLTDSKELLNYLKSSDIVVTKSGGLTSSEVAVIGKPVVMLDINGGQERFNSNFFSDRGMGLMTDKEKQVGPKINVLLGNPVLRAQMIEAQGQLRDMINPKKISDWIEAQPTHPWSVSKGAYCRTLTEATGS